MHRNHWFWFWFELKNHSVNLRNCWDAVCDSKCSLWFSSFNWRIVSFNRSFSFDNSFTENKTLQKWNSENCKPCSSSCESSLSTGSEGHSSSGSSRDKRSVGTTFELRASSLSCRPKPNSLTELTTNAGLATVTTQSSVCLPEVTPLVVCLSERRSNEE